jgi:transposase
MMSQYMFHRVRELAAAGTSARGIAKALGIDKKTVAKYLQSNAPPRYTPRRAPTKADPFAAFAAAARGHLANAPELTGPELYLLLLEQGYQGSERTVERRLAAFRAEKPKERFFEQVYEAGEQAQFDFKEKVTIPFRDGPRVVQLVIGTLPFSDCAYAKAFPFCNFEAFIDGIHSTYEKAGGLTRNIRIDNLSPCVAKIRSGADRLYTAAFQRAIAYYGFGVLPCAPGKGSEKGDVERDIRTHARRIRNAIRVTGRVFVDFDDLNDWLDAHMEKTRTPSSRERLVIERQALLPLPPRDTSILCRVETTPASSYGIVRVSKSAYSVPDTAIGLSCRVELSGYEAVIYRIGGDGREVARHPRKIDGESSILLAHVLPSLIRKPGAMVRWAHRDILFPLPGFKRFYGHLKSLTGINAEREFLRAVNLVQHVQLQDIGAGMELVLETGGANPVAELRRILGLDGDAQAAMEAASAAQPVINPELSQYDQLIPELEDQSA